ncbi:response regulator [bacterium]|nr:MAG: response regulator [bacterium]
MPLVLYVDDDTMSLNLMEKVSKLLGYQALTCSSPTLAITMAQERQPDVIVADLNMHEMDGVALIRAIRNQLTTRHIPIIVLSATDADSGRRRSSAAGANDYITKPVAIDTLSDAIDRVLLA